jgi:hypothetical protein
VSSEASRSIALSVWGRGSTRGTGRIVSDSSSLMAILFGWHHKGDFVEIASMVGANVEIQSLKLCVPKKKWEAMNSKRNTWQEVLKA